MRCVQTLLSEFSKASGKTTVNELRNLLIKRHGEYPKERQFQFYNQDFIYSRLSVLTLINANDENFFAGIGLTAPEREIIRRLRNALNHDHVEVGQEYVTLKLEEKGHPHKEYKYTYPELESLINTIEHRILSIKKELIEL